MSSSVPVRFEGVVRDALAPDSHSCGAFPGVKGLGKLLPPLILDWHGLFRLPLFDIVPVGSAQGPRTRAWEGTIHDALNTDLLTCGTACLFCFYLPFRCNIESVAANHLVN